MSYKKQKLLTICEHLSFLPRYFGRIRVAHLFSFLCCPIVFLYALSSVLWSPLRFPHRNDFRFVFTSSCSYEGSCLIHVICVCLRLVVSNAYCDVYLLCFPSSCVPSVASFSGLSFCDCPIRDYLTFMCNLTILSSSVTLCLFLEHLLRGVCIIITPLSLL